MRSVLFSFLKGIILHVSYSFLFINIFIIFGCRKRHMPNNNMNGQWQQWSQSPYITNIEYRRGWCRLCFEDSSGTSQYVLSVRTIASLRHTIFGKTHRTEEFLARLKRQTPDLTLRGYIITHVKNSVFFSWKFNNKKFPVKICGVAHVAYQRNRT